MFSTAVPRPSPQEEAFLKRYIEYCRQNCCPRITESAAKLLANEYVELRAEVGGVCVGVCVFWGRGLALAGVVLKGGREGGLAVFVVGTAQRQRRL